MGNRSLGSNERPSFVDLIIISKHLGEVREPSPLNGRRLDLPFDELTQTLFEEVDSIGAIPRVRVFESSGSVHLIADPPDGRLSERSDPVLVGWAVDGSKTPLSHASDLD